MRVVGRQDHSEIELDPVIAFHRGRKLDAMLGNALPPHPRGVFRGTTLLRQLDEQRMIEAARRLNEE